VKRRATGFCIWRPLKRLILGRMGPKKAGAKGGGAGKSDGESKGKEAKGGTAVKVCSLKITKQSL